MVKLSKHKKVATIIIGGAILVSGLIGVDSYLDSELQAWYEERYAEAECRCDHNCVLYYECACKLCARKPGEAYLPPILTYYEMAWKFVGDHFPAVAQFIWERPEYGKRVPAGKYHEMYLNYTPRNDVVFVVGSTNKSE